MSLLKERRKSHPNLSIDQMQTSSTWAHRIIFGQARNNYADFSNSSSGELATAFTSNPYVKEHLGFINQRMQHWYNDHHDLHEVLSPRSSNCKSELERLRSQAVSEEEPENEASKDGYDNPTTETQMEENLVGEQVSNDNIRNLQ